MTTKPGFIRGHVALALALGVTQTIGFGTLYYAFGVLAPAMSRDTGLSTTAVFGFFSLGLLVSGLFAPWAGRMLDRFDPARVMAIGSVGASAALILWALVPGRTAFAAFCILVQVVSVVVLYEAAFVLAAKRSVEKARRTITGITLMAGFASTIFWPLTTWLAQFMGWREVYLVYALLNLLVCAPIHGWLARAARSRVQPARSAEPLAERQASAQPLLIDERHRRQAFAILLVAFSANAYVISAVHLHLIGLLGALGFAASAALIGACIGPSQVAGRIMEFMGGERVSVLTVAILSAAALPIGLTVLVAGAGILPAAIVFAVIFGLGQGLSYIVRGVLPLALFGTAGYGALTGRINQVRLFVSAAAPFVTAALFERLGVGAALGAIIFVGVVGVAALVAIMPILRRARDDGEANAGP